MSKNKSDEFRQDAVRIALISGLTRREVSVDLGVGLSMLYKWIKQFGSADAASVADAELLLENEKLRRGNRILKEEYPSWSSCFFNPFSMIA
jgi:transposase